MAQVAQEELKRLGIIRDIRLKWGLTVRRRIRDTLGVPQRVDKLRERPEVVKLIDEQSKLPLFTKDQAFYVDRSIYPMLTCQDCIYFISPNRCVVVSEVGGSGEIKPEGTSTLFNASKRRIQLVETMYGRGEAKKGVAPEIIRKRVMPIGRDLVYPDVNRMSVV